MGLLEYHGGLWLFHFINAINAFLVSFPGSLALLALPRSPAAPLP